MGEFENYIGPLLILVGLIVIYIFGTRHAARVKAEGEKILSDARTEAEKLRAESREETQSWAAQQRDEVKKEVREARKEIIDALRSPASASRARRQFRSTRFVAGRHCLSATLCM